MTAAGTLTALGSSLSSVATSALRRGSADSFGIASTFSDDHHDDREGWDGGSTAGLLPGSSGGYGGPGTATLGGASASGSLAGSSSLSDSAARSMSFSIGEEHDPRAQFARTLAADDEQEEGEGGGYGGGGGGGSSGRWQAE
jgi:hypothetical protein